MKRLDDAWLKKEPLTFYALEDELEVQYKPGWTRGDLLRICRYLYLDNRFDHQFWEKLVTNGECPIEAHGIMSIFDRTDDIYFM